MSSENGNKPIGKSGQRNRNTERRGRKKARRSKEADAHRVPEPTPVADQSEGAQEQINEPAQIGKKIKVDEPNSTLAAPAQGAPVEASGSDTFPAVSAVRVAFGVVTIADAYNDYTRKSLKQTLSLLEKLAALPSLDRVIELETEFAKEAFETLMTDSLKIRKLHGELTRQSILGF
ncbi:phasin family protein [Bradyrhizobium sp. BRP22]|uniref:phasin family protein n=1 Tax=Bradyrhizobium sp. BRP22 TaxID=2793821 RepID=UPI001CD52F56|nr:phasin family protein [Bradyrhizobium sp. BRP22]MCA1458421.1 phasin family protein [Bradyrhizobium sp. BRP22]